MIVLVGTQSDISVEIYSKTRCYAGFCHPAATSLVDFGGMTYAIHAALTPCDGDTLCYEIFGEVAIGKMMGGCVVTPDGDVIEGEALSEVIVIGRVILTITPLYDWGRPTI